jgi:hypothetical protein
MWAAAERHPAVVKLLLDRGADWKVRSFDRETKMPRLSAASAVTPLPRGGLPAVSFAAREGDVESVRAMLDNVHGGVDINYGDVDNTTALIVAIMNKQYTFAKFLIDRGADVSVAGGYGRTALYALIDLRNEDYAALPARKTEDPLPTLDLFRALLDRRPNLNSALATSLHGKRGMDLGDATLGEGTTPLMRAARAGDTAVIRPLPEKGADSRLPTKDGNTAGMFAAGVGYRDKNTRGSEPDALEPEDSRRGRPRRPSGEQPRRNGAARCRRPRRGQHRASCRSRRRSERQSKQGLHRLMWRWANQADPLPIPKPTTVALLKKLGALEAKDVRGSQICMGLRD